VALCSPLAVRRSQPSLPLVLCPRHGRHGAPTRPGAPPGESESESGSESESESESGVVSPCDGDLAAMPGPETQLWMDVFAILHDGEDESGRDETTEEEAGAHTWWAVLAVQLSSGPGLYLCVSPLRFPLCSVHFPRSHSPRPLSAPHSQLFAVHATPRSTFAFALRRPLQSHVLNPLAWDLLAAPAPMSSVSVPRRAVLTICVSRTC
jgi:hypothetical protein